MAHSVYRERFAIAANADAAIIANQTPGIARRRRDARDARHMSTSTFAAGAGGKQRGAAVVCFPRARAVSQSGSVPFPTAPKAHAHESRLSHHRRASAPVHCRRSLHRLCHGPEGMEPTSAIDAASPSSAITPNAPDNLHLHIVVGRQDDVRGLWQLRGLIHRPLQ